MRYANVVVSPEFRDSVDAVADFVAQRSPLKAEKIVEALQAVSTLDENARRGRMVPELMDDALRELLILNGEYRLIYRLDDERSVVAVYKLWPARKPLKLGDILDGE